MTADTPVRRVVALVLGGKVDELVHDPGQVEVFRGVDRCDACFCEH